MPRDEVAADDSAGLAVDEDQFQHLVPCKHFHVSAVHLFHQGAICAEKKLLACLALCVERAADLGAAERAVGDEPAVLARKRNALRNAVVDDVFTELREPEHVGLARPEIATLDCVVEKPIDAVAVVLVILGSVDASLGGDAVSPSRRILDAKGFNKGINFRYCLYLDSRDPTFSIGHVTSTITKENISIFQYIIDFTSNEFAKRYKSFKDEFFSIENDFRQGYLEPKQDKVTSDTNRKSFVLSDLNKPVLNQKQIAILFRLLWERRIIRNAELDKKPYSEIISNLTGYSKNTIRQDLSEKSITDLVRNPSDFDRIIEQFPYRNQLIRSIISEWGIKKGYLSAVVGRSGPRTRESGTYEVNQKMVDDVKSGKVRAEHPAILRCLLAKEIAERTDSIMLDSVGFVVVLMNKGYEKKSVIL